MKPVPPEAATALDVKSDEGWNILVVSNGSGRDIQFPDPQSKRQETRERTCDV